MMTTTLASGVVVLAKPNGYALNYGNRTLAAKKAATIPGAWVYQPLSPARGFYIALPEAK